MNLFLYLFGLFMLYCPPLFVWLYTDLIDQTIVKIKDLTYYIFIISAIFTIIMFNVMPTVPLFVFGFYMITFNGIFLLYNKIFNNKGEAFRVAIYVCFAISVLWEWPIQLTNTQNINAVILSGFKALGIPFFIVTVKKRMWDLTWMSAMFLVAIVFYGLTLTNFLTYINPNEIYFLLHFYRILWLVWFILIIIETYINSKDLKKRQYNRK